MYLRVSFFYFFLHSSKNHLKLFSQIKIIFKLFSFLFETDQDHALKSFSLTRERLAIQILGYLLISL